MKLGVHEGRIQSCRPVGSSHPVMIVGHWHSPAHTETSGDRPESQPVRRGSRLTCIRPAVCNYRLQPTSASRSPELPTALPLLASGIRSRFKPARESSQQAQHRWQLRRYLATQGIVQRFPDTDNAVTCRNRRYPALQARENRLNCRATLWWPTLTVAKLQHVAGA